MRRAVLVSGVVVLAAVAVLALFLYLRPPAAPDAAFEALLASVDSSISQGYLSTAADALRSVRDVQRSEGDQLRLLRRAFEIAASTKDYSLLAELAGTARVGAGGSARLRAVAAFAFLRTGRVADARRLFNSGRAAADGLESLRGETLLRSGDPWPGSDELTRDVLALESSSEPSALVNAGLRAGDRRLFLDAAVVAMQQGRRGEAADIVRSHLGDARFNEPAGLILYDAGAPREAAARLARRFSEAPSTGATGFVLADISAEGGDDAAAQAWLQRSLPLAPGLSWTPYADLSLFLLQRGDLPSAARRLDDGLAFFPQSRDLKILKARVLARSGDTEAAITILNGLAEDRPSDTDAALLLLSLQGPALSPEALRGGLWRLFELAPTDAAVFDRLASALTAARDWEGMRIAVRERQSAGGSPDAHSLLLEGFVEAMRGNDDSALAAFRQSDGLAKDGTGRFNAALVLLHRRATRAARDELELAAGEVEAAAGPQRSSLLSRIETVRAASLMLDGDLPGASTALYRARQLNPSNRRAVLLQRKLEAGGQ